MIRMGGPGDFYEDDEPLKDVLTYFEQGEHGVTQPPVVIDTVGLVAPGPCTTTYRARLSVGPVPSRRTVTPVVAGNA